VASAPGLQELQVRRRKCRRNTVQSFGYVELSVSMEEGATLKSSWLVSKGESEERIKF